MAGSVARRNGLEEASVRSLTIPASTILKVLLAAACVWFWFQLVDLVLVLLVAVELAIAFEPAVAALERRRVPRAIAATVLVLGVVALSVWFIELTGATLLAQARQVLGQADTLRATLANRLPIELERPLDRIQL